MKTGAQVIREIVEIPIQVSKGSLSGSEAVEKSLKIMEDFEKEIYKEPNEFIKDIAKLFGEDNLGKDGISWSIDDFKNAIQETKKDQERITIEAACKKINTEQNSSIFKIYNLIKNTKTIED